MRFNFFLFLTVIPFLTSHLLASHSYSPQRYDPIHESLFWTLFPELNNYEFNCMAEDAKGSIWFGCRGKIARYNGKEWTFFSYAENVENDRVLTICPDDKGNIYAGTESGLYQYNEDGWKKMIPLQGHRKIQINEVKNFSDGSIWIASDKGLFIIQNKKIFFYTIDNIALELIDSLPEITIGLFQAEFKTGFNVMSVCQGRLDEVLFSLDSGEIVRTNRLNPEKKIDIWQVIDQDKGIEKNMPKKLMLSDDGKIWFITSQSNTGIKIYDMSQKQWTPLSLSRIFGGDDINVSIIQTRDGRIWIGGHGRLFTYFNGHWKQFTHHETPLPAARIELLETKDGSVWIGGKHNETYRLDYAQKRWEILTGLNFHCESPDSIQWFISDQGRVAAHNLRDTSWISYGIEDGLIDTPLTLITASNGYIWAAGSDQSIAATAYFDGRNWIKQSHPKLGSCIHYLSAFQSADSSLWFGSYEHFLKKGSLGGVIQIELAENGHLKKSHYSSDESGKIGIVGITQLNDNSIWTAGNYIVKYDGKKWKTVSDPAEFSTGWLDDIKCDEAGGLWVAKEGVGLFYLPEQSGTWKKYTVLDGLVHNTVLSILPLKDQTVLAGTNKGISRFDGRSWIKYALPSSIYLKRDEGTLRQSSDGTIWINFAARSWHRRAFEPVTASDQKYIDKNFRTIHYIPEKIPPKTTIILAPERVSDEGNIFIQWKGADYLHQTPDNMIQFSYRLDNSPWSEYSYDTQKLFLSLEKGAHLFEIRARDQDLNVEPQSQRHIFIVSLPLWLRPWFISLLSFFITAIIILLTYLYKKQILINNLQAAKVHEMDMMKLRFYTNLSHDLRTPLNLILSPLTDLLEKTKNNSNLKQQYELMHRNAIRLNSLVNEIIDFRKIEAGSMEYSPSSGCIKKFIESIADSFKLLALKRKIELKIMADFEDQYVLFDKEKLETILYNLLSNAFKFTPPNGQINLHLKLKPRGNGEVMELKVEDSGPGIPEEKIPTIFERFIQLETAKFGDEKSSGIGLALTKELVEICRGTITVKNREQGGAEFTVDIPLEKSNREEAIEGEKLLFQELQLGRKEDNQHQDAAKAKPIILVVEDYADEREYLVNQLLDLFDVISAEDGKKGMQKAIEVIPDLIICDIKMPVMDGFEFCKSLRENVATSHIPIIFLTGSHAEEVEIEGLRIGADDYMVKPFKLSVLLARIQNLFESRRILKEKYSATFPFDSDEITAIDKNFFQKAFEIVSDHLDDETFDVQAFCTKIGMSRTQLFRKFKALIGQTPNTYIRMIRLQKAAFLLKHTHKNVTEICYEVGYKYPGHFSDHFKKQYGLSPKAYQKKK